MAEKRVCDGIRKLRAIFGRRWCHRSEEPLLRSAVGGLLHVANGVRSSVSENGLVLLHISSGLVFTANQTGARIWSEIAQGTCPDLVGRGLSQEYGLPVEQTTQDVTRFVGELVAQGLLVPKRS